MSCRLLVCMGMILIFFVLTGCTNKHQSFCELAASNLCEKCQACGQEGFRQCGMRNHQDVAQCVEMYVAVCSAYDGIYNQELSQSCLERIETLECNQLLQSGKPEVCNRLF